MTRTLLAAALMLTACAGADDASDEATDTGGADTSVADTSDSDTAETADPCDALVCDNGSCVDDGETTSCDCDSGRQGDLCEVLTPPPSQGLVLWLDANDPLANGTMPTEIDVWVDRSGGTANFTAPSGREPATLAVGERTVAAFDGADFLLRTGFVHLTDTAHYTIIVVGKARGLGQSLVGAAEEGTNQSALSLETVSGSNMRYSHTGADGTDEVSTGSGPVAEDRLHRSWVVRTISPNTHRELVLYADEELGVSMSTGSASDFAGDLDFVIGAADGTGTGALNGEIGEVLVYVGARTPGSDPEIEDYLRAKWDIE